MKRLRTAWFILAGTFCIQSAISVVGHSLQLYELTPDRFNGLALFGLIVLVTKPAPEPAP